MIITIQDYHDLPIAFNIIHEQSDLLGMKLLQKTQLITAASELMTNMIKYANGGEVEIQASNMGRKKIVVVFTDKGPGIPDVDLALTRGFSSGKTYGIGLPGARQLTDEFSITTTVGTGTTIKIAKWV